MGRILGVLGTLQAIALVFAGLRFYARLVMRKSFGLDDGLMVVCVVSTSTRLCLWSD